MKYLVILLVVFCSGCSTFETLGDYVKENPIIASASFRYAAAKYINNDQERADEVIETASIIKALIDSNPTITVSGVMQYLDATIKWDSKTSEERLLIRDILRIVEANLNLHETENPLVNINELLDTIISAALLHAK